MSGNISNDNIKFTSELRDENKETNAMDDITVEKSVSPNFHPTEPRDDHITKSVGKKIKEFNVNEATNDAVLDDFIVKALEKVKKSFLQNDIEEQRLAEFMFKILTLSTKCMDSKDSKMNPETLNKLVDQIIENRENHNDSDGFNQILESLIGSSAAKASYERLCTEKIDGLIERLLGKDTKKLICDRLESENLDDLLNKIVDEKLSQDNDSQASHPNLDDFIGKILGKETRDFIRNNMQAFSNEN